MTSIAPVMVSLDNGNNAVAGVLSYKWLSLTETNNDGLPVQHPNCPDRSVQVVGTFGGGQLDIEGSIDGTNWHILNDPQGNPLSFTAAKIEAIAELVRYIRPKVSSGTGVSLECWLILRI